MTKIKTNKWTAPQRKGIQSVDISAVVFKPTTRINPYLRTPTYRKQTNVRSTLIGTNSECY